MIPNILRKTNSSSVSCLFKNKFLATGILMCSASLIASADSYYVMNFENLFSEEEQQTISPERLLDFVNEHTENTSGFLKDITYCEGVFMLPDGLGKYQGTYKSDTGALFIYSNPDNEEEATGGVSFEINPAYWNYINKINFITYKFIDNVPSGSLPTEIEAAINGGNYTTLTTVKNDGTPKETLSLPTNGEIVKTIDLRIPNVMNKPDIGYFLAFSRIALAYEEKAPKKVTSWRFDKTSGTAYIDDSQPSDLPLFTATPSEAAQFAVFTSDNTEVADFEDGDLILKNPGETVITATIGENQLFSATEPASYTLSVKQDTSTVVISPCADSSEITLTDLQGRKVNGSPTPGIYIVKREGKVTKVLIK